MCEGSFGGVYFSQELAADGVAGVGFPVAYELVVVAEGAPVEEYVGDAIVKGLIGDDPSAGLRRGVEATRGIGRAHRDQCLLDLERRLRVAGQVGLVPDIRPMGQILPWNVRRA